MKKKTTKVEELESKIEKLESTIDYLNKLIDEKNAWINYLQNQVITKLDKIKEEDCNHEWQYINNTTAPYRTCLKCSLTQYVKVTNSAYNNTIFS